MKKQTETNETELHFVNTLTHDKHNPLTCGFCLSYAGAGDIKLVQHNGFDNLTDEDIEKFEQIVAMLKLMKFAKDKENRNGKDFTRDSYCLDCC